MRQRYLVKKLLKNNKTEKSYNDYLDIPDNYDKYMLSCRSTVREKLREDFKQHRNNTECVSNEDEKLVKTLTPKFFTQGSHAYKTQNMPCYSNQEVDLDDGVYFPMSFVENSPKANKTKLVSLVRQSLSELSKREGWPLTEKKMCFRLQVATQIHIDVPIYAIPDAGYAALTEMRNRQLMFAEKDEFIQFQRLDPTQVYIALLDDDEPWHSSDPKQLHDWFVSETKRYPYLRNVCRYLKAWRDFQWQQGGPSSIMLMVAASKALNDFPKTPDSECEALLVVAQALPSIFGQDINNPVDENENMFPSRCKDDAEAEDIRAKVDNFASSYASALCLANSKQTAVDNLRSTFGVRLPDRQDWVKDKATPEAIRKKPVVAASAITPTAAISHTSGND